MPRPLMGGEAVGARFSAKTRPARVDAAARRAKTSHGAEGSTATFLPIALASILALTLVASLAARCLLLESGNLAYMLWSYRHGSGRLVCLRAATDPPPTWSRDPKPSRGQGPEHRSTGGRGRLACSLRLTH